MDINKLSGAQLIKLIADFYPDDPTPTADKLDTVLTYLDPIMYLLKYHSVKGGPLTFDIPNYDMSKAVRHRPWQKEIIEAMCDREIKDVTVMKGRQQG